ncbi:MAG: hypothetical protein FD175_2538 [Beijerinckiaceae bacterium]|nr:MAG: hypothetical protein FD175_2538 [Beijerinckiaceae bacterium]
MPPSGPDSPTGGILPWVAMMAFGLGTLRLSSHDFWGMTLPEFKAAARGHRGELGIVDPIPADVFASLMQRFPDAPPPGAYPSTPATGSLFNGE